MSTTTSSAGVEAGPNERLEALFDEVAELTGQRNAIDGRLVEIAAEIDRDQIWGATGARSIAALLAWKTGVSPSNAATMAAVAHRFDEFPRCTEGLRAGRLSLDQVGVIAQRAGTGSDEHYAQLAGVATVSQLRTAIKLEPRPEPGPRPEPQPAITKTSDTEFDFWRITLPHAASATFDAALTSHRDALIAEWKHDHAVPGDARLCDIGDQPALFVIGNPVARRGLDRHQRIGTDQPQRSAHRQLLDDRPGPVQLVVQVGGRKAR